MANTPNLTHDINIREQHQSDNDTTKSLNTPPKVPSQIETTRLPTPPKYTTYHIYHKHDRHTTISASPSAPKHPLFRPSLSNQAPCLPSQSAHDISTQETTPTFFLHKPRLAFHTPPHVLYTKSPNTHRALPAVLIHPTCLWRTYTLHLVPPLISPSLLDPRGVVPRPHNACSHHTQPTNHSSPLVLKSYKARTWRIWGDSGKAYTRSLRTQTQNQNQKHAEKRNANAKGNDADITIPPPPPSPPPPPPKCMCICKPPYAKETLYLTWTSPFSLHPRRYTFSYRDTQFSWKGTRSTTTTVVDDARARCWDVWCLRFNHLKLVAEVPGEEHGGGHEVCLGKYVSSVARRKSGVLELFDGAMVGFAEEYAPRLLERASDGDGDGESEDGVVGNGVEEKMARLRTSTWYQVIVATAVCMIASEKEKRHTLIDLLVHAAEGAGGAGGGS